VPPPTPSFLDWEYRRFVRTFLPDRRSPKPPPFPKLPPDSCSLSHEYYSRWSNDPLPSQRIVGFVGTLWGSLKDQNRINGVLPFGNHLELTYQKASFLLLPEVKTHLDRFKNVHLEQTSPFPVAVSLLPFIRAYPFV